MKRLLLVLLFLSGLPAYSQTSLEQKRTCRIVFPERPNKSTKFAYLYDGEKSQRVYLPNRNFSNVINLPLGELTLVMTRDGITDSEKLPPGAPTLKIPEAVRDFYVLVSPDPDNKELPVRMILLNASDGKLLPGKTLWFNLTKHRILAKLGENNMSVAPNSQTISDRPRLKSGYYRAEFDYEPNAVGEARRITEQQWWHDARSKHLGVIVSSGAGLPKIFFFRDFR